MPDRTDNPHFYKRLIDNIVLVWAATEAAPLKYISEFNNFHPSIRFPYLYTSSSLCFLDVTVAIVNNRLTTKLFRKPTDRQQYLNFTSSHPRYHKTATPYNQAHRFKRVPYSPEFNTCFLKLQLQR